MLAAILTGAVALIFVVAGIVNIRGSESVRDGFTRAGYPEGFNIVCGGLEVVGAALMLWPVMRPFGFALLGVIMVAAIATLLRLREPFTHLAPALAISALLAVTAAVAA
jgi:uncharacterized membrane protein YphA (DoxX/SURF4 family)